MEASQARAVLQAAAQASADPVLLTPGAADARVASRAPREQTEAPAPERSPIPVLPPFSPEEEKRREFNFRRIRGLADRPNPTNRPQ